MTPWYALLAGMTLAELQSADRDLWFKTFDFAAGVPREEIDRHFDEKIEYLIACEALKAMPEDPDCGK